MISFSTDQTEGKSYNKKLVKTSDEFFSNCFQKKIQALQIFIFFSFFSAIKKDFPNYLDLLESVAKFLESSVF